MEINRELHNEALRVLDGAFCEDQKHAISNAIILLIAGHERGEQVNDTD